MGWRMNIPACAFRSSLFRPEWIIFGIIPLLHPLRPEEGWVFKTGLIGMISGLCIAVNIRRIPPMNPALQAAFCWPAFIAARAVFSPHPEASLLPLAEGMILPVVAMLFPDPARSGRSLRVILLIQGILLLPFALGLRIGSQNWRPFYNENYLAFHLMATAMVLHAFWSDRAVPFALVCGAMFTGTSSVLPGFLAYCASAVTLSMKNNPAWKYAALCAAAFGFLILLSLTLRELPGKSSWEHRLLMWKSALFMFREAPFIGKGPGTYFVHYPRAIKEYPALNTKYNLSMFAHNDPMEVMAECGITGVTVYFAIFATICARLSARFSAVYVGMFFAGLFSMPSHMGTVQALLGLCLAGGSSVVEANWDGKRVPAIPAG
ncbi:MAG: O-antigen ligase family protein, partial [Candidatus Wallbacteria bacterium]|nr:O-antigen ligase family protein [Candidatus Wallbacteria bacterium]